jgi:hypothetical protein
MAHRPIVMAVVFVDTCMAVAVVLIITHNQLQHIILWGVFPISHQTPMTVDYFTAGSVLALCDRKARTRMPLKDEVAVSIQLAPALEPGIC